MSTLASKYAMEPGMENCDFMTYVNDWRVGPDIVNDIVRRHGENQAEEFVLVGHSYGAMTAIQVARELEGLGSGVQIALLVLIDAVDEGRTGDNRDIPANVRRVFNRYQTSGWFHGASVNVAAGTSVDEEDWTGRDHWIEAHDSCVLNGTIDHENIDDDMLVQLEALAEIHAVACPGISSVWEDFEWWWDVVPWPTWGNAEWHVTRGEAHAGHCSAQAGAIGNSEYTCLALETEVTTGPIGFWYKVSSESGYDELCFSIDYEEVGWWSGDTGWSYASFFVSPGYHVFIWEYRKDGSASSGEDTAWIDDVTFGGMGAACYEPNDWFDSACWIRTPYSGQHDIASEYDSDFFVFEASYGTTVLIDIDAESIGSHLDSTLSLYDEDGDQVAWSDDADGHDSYIEATLYGDAYYIEVAGYGSSTGSYILTVETYGHSGD